jgi:predicted ATPase
MIKSLEIRNFKAIEKGKVKLSPLTAFIGYNGTGKSSMLEALETFQVIVTDGLEKSMSRWRKFEHIHFKGTKKKREFISAEIKYTYAPMEFLFSAVLNKKKVGFSSSIGEDLAGHIYFLEEAISHPDSFIKRNPDHKVITHGKENIWLKPEISILSAEREILKYVESWQFLAMNTFLMGNPYPQKKTGGKIILNHDGSNIAEYILAIREAKPDVFRGIIETMQFVLPYASDIQPVITEELEKMVYMQLSEQDFKVPGWLLSTGTLKVLALLAVFRNPNPSPLIVVEEIENGLDPRSIHLVVDEMRRYIENKNCQVMITSHSPYLLDLLKLEEIIVVEKTDGQSKFSRPSDNEELQAWSEKFNPGKLYTMSRLKTN